MRSVFRKRSFKVLCAAVAFLLVLSVVSAGNSYVNNFLTSYILTPIQQLASKGTDSVGKALTPPQSIEKLEKEVGRLSEENDRLYDMLVDYYDVKAENEELRRFYGIKSKNKDFSVLPAEVIGRDPNENFYGFTLDRGSLDGVEMNAPVMTEKGLVGRVCEVAPRSCKVTAILSPDAGVGAILQRTMDSGVIKGDPLISDDGLTRLINLSSRDKIKKGDIAVTSGYGGVFPKNLKIGTVSYTALDDYSGTYYAVIEPFEDIRVVSSVVIVTDFEKKDLS